MIDWSSFKSESLTHLQNLLRINTTNPPGNEIEAIRYLSMVLSRENIPHQILESAPGRANLVARLAGNGSKKPLLLTAHVDVVPAEADKWKHPPFSGEVAEGCVWGRGAVDMKNMVVMSLMMMVAARREGKKFSRDLIFAAVADEEAACRYGSQWLVENYADLVRAEYALNEVGGFSLPVDGKIFYPIGVGERGLCWFRAIAEGRPGHGSMPHNDQALVRLALAVHRLGQNNLPFHAPSVSRRFVQQIAASMKFPKNIVLNLLQSPLFHRFINRYIVPAQKRTSFHVMFHNTVSPTIFRSGEKGNVIPSRAEVVVDGRVLPGESTEKFLVEVRKVLGEGFDIEVIRALDPPAVQPEDNFYQLLTKVLTNHHPGCLPVPYLIPGFTDSAFYSKLGIKCYGFAPVRLPPDIVFSDLFHGHNERIPVEGFEFGLKVLWDVVEEVCG